MPQFNSGQPYHGSDAVKHGRLRGTTGPDGDQWCLNEDCIAVSPSAMHLVRDSPFIPIFRGDP